MKSNFRFEETDDLFKKIKARLSLILIFVFIIVLYISMIVAAILLLVQGIGLLFHPVASYGDFFISFFQIMMALVIIKGMLVWQEPDGGIVVTDTDEPELFSVIEEVARKVGTDMADEVRIYPNSAIGVYETSNLLKIFLPGRRVLMLGIATLSSLTVDELKAILAHEFAHFSNRDTFYNRFISRAGFALISVISALRLNIFWVMNPIYWYLNLFNMIFSYLVGNFSRQREFFADAIAAQTYGSQIFNSALEKYSTESTIFEHMVTREVRVFVREGKYVDNIYNYHQRYKEQLPSHVLESMEKSTSSIDRTPFKTHPDLPQRLQEVAKLDFPSDYIKDTRLVKMLFKDPPELEREMTALFYLLYIPEAIEAVDVVTENEYQFGFDERRLEAYADEFIERVSAVFNLRLEYTYESLRLLDELIRQGALVLLKVDRRYLTYISASYMAVVIIRELGGRWNPYGQEGPALEDVGSVEGLNVNPFIVVDASLSAPGQVSIDEFFRDLKTRLLSGAF